MGFPTVAMFGKISETGSRALLHERQLSADSAIETTGTCLTHVAADMMKRDTLAIETGIFHEGLNIKSCLPSLPSSSSKAQRKLGAKVGGGGAAASAGGGGGKEKKPKLDPGSDLAKALVKVEAVRKRDDWETCSVGWICTELTVCVEGDSQG